MMWFCGQMSRNKTIIIVVSSFSILLLTHTRTALVAMIGGVIVGGLSLISASTRVRKVFIGATAVVAVVLTTLILVLSLPGSHAARVRSS